MWIRCGLVDRSKSFETDILVQDIYLIETIGNMVSVELTTVLLLYFTVYSVVLALCILLLL